MPQMVHVGKWGYQIGIVTSLSGAELVLNTKFFSVTGAGINTDAVCLLMFVSFLSLH
jgi:hypothetical protein